MGLLRIRCLFWDQDAGMEREVEGDSVGSTAGGGGAIGFWQHVEAGLREQAERLRSDLAVIRQESHELQERLMVSEATVQAQAEQLKDYRELLSEGTDRERHIYTLFHTPKHTHMISPKGNM